MSNGEYSAKDPLWVQGASILLPAAIFGSYTLVALLLGCKELAIAAAIAGVVGVTVVGGMTAIDLICPIGYSDRDPEVSSS